MKAELARRGTRHKVLVRLLSQIGVTETEASIANKLARGTFSFVFYLQCMTALNCSVVEIRLADIANGQAPTASAPE